MYPFWLDFQASGILQWLPAALGALALCMTRIFSRA